MSDTFPNGGAVPRADQSPREALIRDLYALAAYYSANPHLPIPHTLTVEHFVETVDELRDLADSLGEIPYGARRSMSHPLPAAPTRVRLHFGVPW